MLISDYGDGVFVRVRNGKIGENKNIRENDRVYGP